jgi:hypothetical protein
MRRVRGTPGSILSRLATYFTLPLPSLFLFSHCVTVFPCPRLQSHRSLIELAGQFTWVRYASDLLGSVVMPAIEAPLASAMLSCRGSNGGRMKPIHCQTAWILWSCLVRPSVVGSILPPPSPRSTRSPEPNRLRQERPDPKSHCLLECPVRFQLWTD